MLQLCGNNLFDEIVIFTIWYRNAISPGAETATEQSASTLAWQVNLVLLFNFDEFSTITH